MAKVLFADDSVAVRKVAERLLTSAGLEVTLAASGEEALECLARERPDLVISDVLMQDTSGFDVCTFIRGQASLSGTPVLLVSGVVNEEIRRQAEVCRADGVLKKPFQGNALQDCVLELMAKASRPEAARKGLSLVESRPAPQPVATSASAPPADSGQLYYVTEEQLQDYHQAVSRVAELTAQTQRLEEIAKRVHELEGLLETEQARSTELLGMVTRLEQGTSRVVELEDLLARERARSAELSQRVEGFAEVQNRLAELERQVAQEHRQSKELAGELERLGQAEQKVKGLEASLARAEENSARLLERVGMIESAFAEANARAEAMEQALTEIGRLAERAGKSALPIRPE
jgi:CheY-like chemotaxis protein